MTEYFLMYSKMYIILNIYEVVISILWNFYEINFKIVIFRPKKSWKWIQKIVKMYICHHK